MTLGLVLGVILIAALLCALIYALPFIGPNAKKTCMVVIAVVVGIWLVSGIFGVSVHRVLDMRL